VEEAQMGAWAFDIMRALVHLHACGVVHRNLSSANVLLDPRVLPLARRAPECGHLTMMLPCLLGPGQRQAVQLRALLLHSAQ